MDSLTADHLDRRCDASTVDEAVQPAEDTPRGVDGCSDASLLGDVRTDEEGLVLTGGKFFSRLFVDVGHKDSRCPVEAPRPQHPLVTMNARAFSCIPVSSGSSIQAFYDRGVGLSSALAHRL